MIKRMIIMLVLTGLVLGGVFGFKVFGYKMMMQHMAGMKNPPQTVSTHVVKAEEWTPTLRAVGTLKAARGVDIAADVSGIIENILFESGAKIEEGATLVQLRADDDRAKLQSFEAAEKLAKITLERDAKLLKALAVSQAVVDADQATYDSAHAAVEQQKALIDKKTIRAPFSGQLGIRAVDVGQYINPGAPIVTLQQLDEIHLDFHLPQQALRQIKEGLKITAKIDTWPGKTFEGEITAINAKVDEQNRNVQVRATFKNPEGLLRPGMFATANVEHGTPESKLTAPQTAIAYNPYGSTVFIVKKGTGEQKVAQQVFVTTGETRGDQVTILSGLKEGDEIVSAGQLKLNNGTPIVINNDIKPLNDPAPLPSDK